MTLRTSVSSVCVTSVLLLGACGSSAPTVVGQSTAALCEPESDGKVTICHVPPGNASGGRTMRVPQGSVSAHQGHGDRCGSCASIAAACESCAGHCDGDVYLDHGYSPCRQICEVECPPDVGSVLIYPYYTSNASSPDPDTEIFVENTHPTEYAVVHTLLVDRMSGAAADLFDLIPPGNPPPPPLCPPYSPRPCPIKARELDPGISGFVVVVAVDALGCPRNFNYLRGRSSVTATSSGHFTGTIAAVPFAALKPQPTTCDETTPLATMNFNGVDFSRAPRRLRVRRVPSLADETAQLVLSGVGGNLSSGATCLTSLSGTLYDEAGAGFPFVGSASGCAHRSLLSDGFPATSPAYSALLTSGEVGALDIEASLPIVGGVFYKAGSTSLGAANLETLEVGTASLTKPVFLPTVSPP
jgi:hypothetical protein